MQITSYSYQAQKVQPPQIPVSSVEMSASQISNFPSSQTGVDTSSSDTPLPAASAGQYALGLTVSQLLAASTEGKGGLMDALLTPSDLNLIQKTTGQIMVPALKGIDVKYYNENGQQVQPSAATNQLAGALEFIRASGGVNDTNGNWQQISSDTAITAADLQGFAKQYERTSLAVSTDLLNQVDTILNTKANNTNTANN